MDIHNITRKSVWAGVMLAGFLIADLSSAQTPPQQTNPRRFGVEGKLTTGTTPTRLQEIPERPIVTSRPLMAVGHLVAIDVKTSSMTLRIDRSRSAFPRRFEVAAKRIGRFEELIEQEFPAIRSYKMTPITMYVNATGSEPHRQLPATGGQLPHDKQLLTPASFHPGDWVGVLYRITPEPENPPAILNLSRLDPNRIEYELDFNPIGRIVTRTTTHTLPLLNPTSPTLPLFTTTMTQNTESTRTSTMIEYPPRD
jgi:hypothetical protein